MSLQDGPRLKAVLHTQRAALATQLVPSLPPRQGTVRLSCSLPGPPATATEGSSRSLPCRCPGGSTQLLVTIPRLWGSVCPHRISSFSLVHGAHVAPAVYFPGLLKGSAETICERNGSAAKSCANQGITRIPTAS